MTSATPEPNERTARRANPYLLLALAALFWSGNHIVGRAIGGHVPPVGVSTIRWLIPSILIWPWVRPHLKRDWPAIRRHWKAMLWLGVTGGALFTALQYVGLQYTTALNVSVLNSLVPVLIVATSAALFRDRISPMQLAGIVVSSLGVLTIIGRGSLDVLERLAFNWGDLIILFNMLVFAIYAACLRLRPPMHWLSFIFVFAVLSVVMTLPFAVLEFVQGERFKADWETIAAIGYVSIFPSVIAFAAWNRGVELIGANRSGPFLHLVPVYTAIFGSALLGEHLAAFHVAGFALILAGVWLASVRPSTGK
ncbi:MAG TPA: DMT family transporter [Pseudolabrys sp.]|jgi:drug/metabolite transporter (DMT)-like permease|nr:DMT family transporter [Pseudolabrys sp.]